jgi:hypothetical protein
MSWAEDYAPGTSDYPGCDLSEMVELWAGDDDLDLAWWVSS